MVFVMRGHYVAINPFKYLGEGSLFQLQVKKFMKISSMTPLFFLSGS